MEQKPNPTKNLIGWTPLSPEQLQQVLPQYEIVEMLGSGGMGAVYQARQRSLKRLVAIKVLPPGGADDGLKLVERFRHEAEMLAQMNHPAIVDVYDFGETPDGLLYFVMEFVDGTDVQRMIQTGGKLSAEHALTIAAHVCDALAYAHQRGLIHRDIKPANVLINREGHVKVADFGLAKMQDPQQSGLTLSNMAMGTPDYAAPEVFASSKTVDHRADLYAVGVMLYQMLTGEVPRGMFKLPSQKSGTDPRFDAIIVRAMEANRDERYQSATEVRKALDEIRTTPLAKDEGTGALPASVVAARPQLLPGAKRKSPARAIGIIAVIVAVLGVVIFFLTRDKAGQPGTTAPSAEPNPGAKGAPLVVAQGKVVDLLALVDVKRDAIAGTWSRDGGDLLVKAEKTGANGTPRLQLPYRPPEEYDFEMEFTPESGNNAAVQILSGYQHSFAWMLDARLSTRMKAGFNRIDGQSIITRADGSVTRPKFLTNGQRHRSTVEVRRTGVRGLLDGEPLLAWGTKPDSYRWLEASPNDALRDALHLGIGAQERALRIHKLTVRELSGAGTVEGTGTEGAGAPKISNWQDVTGAAHERAKAIPGLIVEADAISWAGRGPLVQIEFPEAGFRDYAMRVQYKGEVQMDLRSTKRGFVYVLSQKYQTMFKRYDKESGATTQLAPTVLHPGFDTIQTHEFLVTMQGTQIRAWLDGRLVSEAQEDTFSEGLMRLTFMQTTVVQKVELAILAGPPPAADGWTDWLGPKLADPYYFAAASGWKREAGGLIMVEDIRGHIIGSKLGRNAAFRMTYELRDAKGVNLTVRERGSDPQRELYDVEDGGSTLALHRKHPDPIGLRVLASVPIPAAISREGERTLEFTVVDDKLTATLNGSVTVTATDSAIPDGFSAVVFRKNALLKKLETKALDAK